MTDLPVTIYDNANAIISIKTMLVRYFSFYLVPVFLGTSQTHGEEKNLSSKKEPEETRGE